MFFSPSSSQAVQIDHLVFHAENVGEAALGQRGDATASGRLQNRASCANLSANAGPCGRELKSCPYRCPYPGPRASCSRWRPWEAVRLISSLALDFLVTQSSLRLRAVTTRFPCFGPWYLDLAQVPITRSPDLPITRSDLILHHLHQMRNLGDHAADGRRIFPLYHLVQPGKAQAL